MEHSWHTRFAYWYRYLRRRTIPDEVDSSIDIELKITCKEHEVVDSSIASIDSSLFSYSQSAPVLSPQPRSSESIYLEIDFGDGICTKSLDYGTFSRWSAVEGLMMDMKDDGMRFEELWDVNESMRICRGDWDARARPGWDVQAHCQNGRAMLETRYLEDDSESEYSESEGDQWIDAILEPYQDEWCLPRWREKVELDNPKPITMQAEPSWTLLTLGCVSIILFVVAAVVYTV